MDSRLGSSLSRLLYFLAGMHDRRMVPAAEFEAELGRRVLGDIPGDIHGDLPRKGDVLRSFLSLEVVVGKLVVVGDDPEDVVDRDIAVLGLAEDVLELVLGDLEGDVLVDELGVGDELRQGGLEVPDVGARCSWR